MAKQWNRTEILLGLVLGGLGLLLPLIFGLPALMKSTATVFHPQPEAAPSVAQSEPAPKWLAAVERSRGILRAGMSEQNLPGLSVAVGVGGEIVWAEGFGFADIDSRAPITPATRFRIGTASKVLTSAGAGLLIEKGRLKLDEPIQTYVPDFPKKEWPVTLRQLMAHLAGVRNDGGDESPLYSQHCERPTQALQHFADRELLSEPGTRFRYSNYGWIPVSAAIESASGKPFLTFMREQVFEPLGMRETLAESTTETIPGRATFYFPRFGADPRYGLHGMRDIDMSCYAGAMIFLSTPTDLVRFAMAIQGGKLLKPATVSLLQADQKTTAGQATRYGLGWDLETATIGGKDSQIVGHDGDMLGGQVASLVIVPERGITVAVISNISYAEAYAMTIKVANAFAEQGTPPAGK